MDTALTTGPRPLSKDSIKRKRFCFLFLLSKHTLQSLREHVYAQVQCRRPSSSHKHPRPPAVVPGHPSPLTGQERECQERGITTTHTSGHWQGASQVWDRVTTLRGNTLNLKRKKDPSIYLLKERRQTPKVGMCAVEGQSSLSDSSEPIKHPIANQKGPGVHPEWVPPNPRTCPSEEHRGAIPICFWRALREGLDAGTPPCRSREGRARVQSPEDSDLIPRACQCHLHKR